VFGLVGIIPLRVSAYFFLGFWFLYQLFEANFGLFNARARGGGVASSRTSAAFSSASSSRGS